MARGLREDVEGAVHHVYARGNGKQQIFADDVDRRVYLRFLATVVRRRGWRLLAYCLMPNHVHLLVETPRANLAAGMQRLQGDYAQRFNRRHGRSGHLFQGRYGAVRVTSDEQLWAAVRYIVANPVEAGLCERAGDYAWSSHAAVLGRAQPAWLDVPRLLELFGARGGDPLARYEEFAGRCVRDPT